MIYCYSKDKLPYDLTSHLFIRLLMFTKLHSLDDKTVGCTNKRIQISMVRKRLNQNPFQCNHRTSGWNWAYMRCSRLLQNSIRSSAQPFEDNPSTNPSNSRGDRRKAIQTNPVFIEKVCRSATASMAWHANLSQSHPKFDP